MLRRQRSTATPFVATPLRVVTIVHLCWVFTYLVWVTARPALEDHMAFKTHMTLCKTVMGHQDLTAGLPEPEKGLALEKLDRHAKRFSHLSAPDQERVREHYGRLLIQPSLGSAGYFRQAGWQLVAGIPPFVQAYLFFSLLICFFLLLRIEGAAPAAWLLPLIIAIFTYTNQAHAPLPTPRADASLYPTEQEILPSTASHALRPSISQQYGLLKRGWEEFLISHYAKETPSPNPEDRALQLEEGEFWFNLARLDRYEQAALTPRQGSREQRESLLLELLMIGWSLFFAGFVTIRQRSA